MLSKLCRYAVWLCAMHCVQIMGEDREYPILRLQPKIKFDIDLQ
jgi:hypothetical protein